MPVAYSLEEVEKCLSLLLPDKNWIKFRLDYCKALGIEEAVVFHFLINQQSYHVKKKTTREDGWFYCKVKKFESFLGINKRQVGRLVANLTKSGCITTKMMGLPAKRYFKLSLVWAESLAGTLPQPLPPEGHNSVPQAVLKSVPLYKKIKKLSKLTVDCAGAQCDGEGESEMLLNGFDGPPKKVKHDVIHLDQAKRLRSALQAKGLMTDKVISIKGWADEIATCAKHYGDVTEVLEWYCTHLGEDYIPDARSGKGFRVKFVKIKSAMDRDRKKNPTVPVTDLGKKVTKRLSHLHWPHATAAQLPAQVEVSLLAHKAFHTKLTDFICTKTFKHRPTITGAEQKLFGFAVRVKTELGTAESFVEKWFRSVWEWAHKKKQLQDLSKWALDPTHKNFTNLGTKWATAYGDPALWLKLLEAVNGTT